MQLQDLSTFLTVASERSFSSAAKKLHRTQPAVSQGIRRLEEELGERLFDRTSRTGTLTEAGRLLQDYAMRLMRLASDAEQAVRELQQVRRGRVVIGANEAAVHTLLPFIERFAKDHPQALVEVRRVPSRQMATELLNRSLDCGVLTFQPPDKGLHAISLGRDELVLLTDDEHRAAAIKDLIESKAVRRNLSLKIFEWGKVEPAGGNKVRQTIGLRRGLDDVLAKKITKLIREEFPKVKSQIQGDAVRVSGKSKDDLQRVIVRLRGLDEVVELQFQNYR